MLENYFFFKKSLFYLLLFLCFLPNGLLAQSPINEVANYGSGEEGEVFVPDLNKTVKQASEEISPVKADEQNANNITGVNCFDYYHFQSVQVSLDTRQAVYKPSDRRVRFFGNLVNENNQPITNGTIFVRVVRKDIVDVDNHDTDIVDEFIGLDKLSLQAKETKQVGFSWNMPSEIAGGDYRANFFFSVGKKFNLGGLPFSNEVIIGFSDFQIESDNDKYIKFDRSKTTVNGEKYYQIGNWPVVKSGDKIDIEQVLVNTYTEDKQVDIRYELYYWDSLHPRDRIDAQIEKINISSQDSKTIVYSIPKVERSVYYLKITAKSGEEKSIINIRILSQLPSPRLNYPAITKFPLRKGDQVTLFSCFHNTSATTSNGHLVMDLYDQNEKIIKELDYQGPISATMMADKVDFTAKQNYDYLRLTAKLYNDQQEVIDQYSTIYDCQVFDACLEVPQKLLNNPLSKYFVNKLYLFIIAFMSIVAIVVIAMFLWFKGKRF